MRPGRQKGGGRDDEVDLLWETLLQRQDLRLPIESRWTADLRQLFPELSVGDISSRFLQPWRGLVRDHVRLDELARGFDLSPGDLPGWELLTIGLSRSLQDAPSECRDRLVVRLTRELAAAASVDVPQEPPWRDPTAPAGAPLPRHHDALPERWTARGQLVGSSPAMAQIVRRCMEVAGDRYPVLVSGETGTGKEVVAGLIHEQSGAKGRLVTVNCAALSEHLIESELFGHERGAFTGATSQHEGLFAKASGGTLLLDEISEIPTYQQAKILRVLQEGLVRRVGSSRHEPVDARVISTSNQVLEEALKSGALRRDLYYRLAVHHIRVPPLRDHPADIPELLAAFLDRWRRRNPGHPAPELGPAAVQVLSHHRWPGNVRELENTVYELASRLPGQWIDAAAVRSVLSESAPELDRLPAGNPTKTRLHDLERDAVVRALALSAGNKAAAARLLGISRKTLYNKLRRHDIES